MHPFLQAINTGMNLTEISRQLNKFHHTNMSPSSSQSSLSIDSAKSNQTQGACHTSTAPAPFMVNNSCHICCVLASAEAMAAARAAQQEMYTALLARRTTLLAEFEMKAARYKEILIKEMVCRYNVHYAHM